MRDGARWIGNQRYDPDEVPDRGTEEDEPGTVPQRLSADENARLTREWERLNRGRDGGVA